MKPFSLKHIFSCLYLFWSRGLAVEVKCFHQSSPQTNNAPRRWLDNSKSTSMKSSHIASEPHTAKPLHLIHQNPWTMSKPVPHGEIILQHLVAGSLQFSSHIEQPVLGLTGCQSQAQRQEANCAPISREETLCFDHFVCSTLSGMSLRASHSWSLNGGASGSCLSVSIKAAHHQDCRQTAQKRALGRGFKCMLHGREQENVFKGRYLLNPTYN